MLDAARILAFTRSALSWRAALPLELQLELTNLCNLDCKMCPRTAIDAPLRHMDERVFEAVLDALRPGVRALSLTGWGEPLTHPLLLDWIKAIKRRSPATAVRLTSNGLLLDERMIAGLAQVGLDAISISIDDIAPEAGSGHGRGAGAAERVRALAAAAAGRGPRIVLQPTLQPDAEQRLERVIELAALIEAEAVNLVRLDVTLLRDLPRPDPEQERRMVERAKDFGRSRGVSVTSINHMPYLGLANHFDRQCIRNFYHGYINVDGDLAPCCRLRGLSMGSLLNHGLAELWRGQRFDAFMRREHPVCRICDGLRRAQRDPRGPGEGR